MSPEEWTYLVVLLISIPIGFLFKKAGESGSLPVENGVGSRVGAPPVRFQAYAVSSPCRTWAEEMGSSSCGPGAHLVHLWPPHFAFSGHHPWDLGPHSVPALVRMGAGGDWSGRGSNLFALWFFLSFCLGLWMSLVYLLFLCYLSFFCLFPSSAFFWVLSLCVCPGLLHLCHGFWREEDIPCLLALPPFIFEFPLPLSPFLSKNMEGKIFTLKLLLTSYSFLCCYTFQCGCASSPTVSVLFILSPLPFSVSEGG